jgi:hypothetical protein
VCRIEEAGSLSRAGSGSRWARHTGGMGTASSARFGRVRRAGTEMSGRCVFVAHWSREIAKAQGGSIGHVRAARAVASVSAAFGDGK